MADGVEMASSDGRRRDLGPGTRGLVESRGRSRWDRLGCVGGFHHRPRPSARDEHCPGRGGASSNYNNPLIEPPDHSFGRSRGGLSTKLHHLVDGHGLPLVVAVTPSQSGDSPMLIPLLAQLRAARPIGRPRTRPDRVRGDKAYSSRAIRQHLGDRGIQAVIPQPADQIGHRVRRGSRGGRPISYDRDNYRNRNVIERRFAILKQWRGLATRYDKLATVYRSAAVLNAVIAWTRHLTDVP